MKKIIQHLFVLCLLTFCLEGIAAGFDSQYRDPKTGMLDGDKMSENYEDLKGYVPEDFGDRYTVSEIRKNFDGSLDLKYKDGRYEHLYKHRNGTYSPNMELGK